MSRSTKEAEPGQRMIGPYRLLELLGRGGMGEVYRARRVDDLRQDVAVKILTTELSGEVLLRFRAERQILANLVHPHIAALLDGGTTAEGRPYLVMELVRGQPLHSFCFEQRLGIEKRLRLFQDVCSAVDAAHRHLIVHRDLKPANVMVDEDGRVKLLDFGIAKLLDPASAPHTVFHTTPGSSPLTLAFASPEQIFGRPITTASDIYSLGILLYFLLTGRHPRRGKTSPLELAAAVRDGPPTRPSVAAAEDAPEASPAKRPPDPHLAQRLAGDLDTIVLEAMHTDPERRYPSARRLADDIERHLAGLPIEARAESGAYVLRRLLRRHRTAAGLAALVALLLVGFLFGLAAERRMTLEQQKRAETTTRFFLQILTPTSSSSDWQASDGQASDGTAGRALLVREALDRGAREIDALADQPRTQADVLETMAGAYQSLGLLGDAEALLERAWQIRRRLARPPDATLAGHLGQAGTLALERAELERARDLLEESVAMWRRLGEAAEGVEPSFALAETLYRLDLFEDSERLYRRAIEDGVRLGASPELLASGLAGLAGLDMLRGRLETAEDNYRAALELLESGTLPDRYAVFAEGAQAETHAIEGTRAISGVAPAEGIDRETLDPRIARYRRELADVLRERAVLEEAEGLYRLALAMQRRLYDGPHPQLAETLDQLSELLYETSRWDEAEVLLDEALDMHHRIHGPEHPTVAGTLERLGLVAQRRLDFTSAAELHERALEIRRRHFGDAHSKVANSLINLASVHSGFGDYTRAESLADDAIAISRRLFGDDHELTATSYNLKGVIASRRGDPETALAAYRRTYEIASRMIGPEHPEATTSLLNVGFTLFQLGRLDEAIETIRRAVAYNLEARGPDHDVHCVFRRTLALVLRAAGELDEAESEARLAVENCFGTHGPHHRLTAQALNVLGYVQIDRGEHDDAAETFRRAVAIWNEAAPDHPFAAGARQRLDELETRAESSAE